MCKGRIWSSGWRNYEDFKTGTTVCQLTNYRGHSHHLYFTNPGWYDNGSKLLFGSDRENRTNLFSIDLKTGEITQLTDLEPVEPPHEIDFLKTSINPTCDVAYFWYDRQVVSLDLKSLQKRTLWEMPKGFMPSMLSCTADGKYICAGIVEDISDRLQIGLSYSPMGERGIWKIWKAHPFSKIICIATDGSDVEAVWEEKTWIGHVNTSPTQPNLITFCHEGPWNKVDNRIWGLDLTTGKVWMIRPREGEERVGHEYWLADGLHIGYHGSWADGQHFFGKIRYNNTERVEVNFPHKTGHTHSNDFSLIAGDGGRNTKVVRLWQRNEKEFDGPRVLCGHRSSFHVQRVHVHPRFSPDGKQVLFTSDASGYGNLYLAQVPEFESLPKLPQEP